MTAAQVATAHLGASDGSQLVCQFNPASVKITKSAQWHTPTTPASKKHPRPQFVGTGPSSLQASLLFDTFDPTGRPSTLPVTAAVERLFGWTCPKPDSQHSTTPEPATVTFTWGSWTVFTGFLRQVGAEYTLFGPDGEPRRAAVAISMQSVPDEPKPTNPTSGGIAGRGSALISAADSLASIAHREYGDPALWRAIAVANEIEDPARVPPGTRVLLPPRAQAAALAAVGGGER